MSVEEPGSEVQLAQAIVPTGWKKGDKVVLEEKDEPQEMNDGAVEKTEHDIAKEVDEMNDEQLGGGVASGVDSIAAYVRVYDGCVGEPLTVHVLVHPLHIDVVGIILIVDVAVEVDAGDKCIC